jgi:hypothetical protein
MGPVTIFQDNLSCLALIRRVGPISERSRHINIRFFWLKQREDDEKVAYEHIPTHHMYANILTKAFQGAQFIAERMVLTNWK